MSKGKVRADMVVRVHGFDTEVYAEQVMPAFARWLVEGEEETIRHLFEGTRCAREEFFLPDPMKRLKVWPRAQAFVMTLPRGPHSRREYARLCSVELFTALSDRYLHHHAPQLYQNSEAVRSVWGAIVEEYCLPWANQNSGRTLEDLFSRSPQEEPKQKENTEHMRTELVSLLQEAGLGELAREVGEQPPDVEHIDWDADEDEDFDEDEDEDEDEDMEDFGLFENDEDVGSTRPQGIILGQNVNVLHLRGWLAGISVRAMALFEFLACGRRCMPFGYEPNEPFGDYIGYLTPDETWQLATCMRTVKPLSAYEVERDAQRFNRLNPNKIEDFRLVDEVLPSYTDEFLKAVRGAALQGLGLICNAE